MNRRSILLAGAGALAACGRAQSQAPAPIAFPMRRGVNLGNALEAPNEGEWGYRIETAHLQAIKDVGFDGIRLPVRWDAHAGSTPPHAIAPNFMRRVDEVVNAALEIGLKVQLDLHHYDALIAAGPNSRHRERFLGMWAVIAHHFRNAPPELYFEPLNEPNGDAWSGRAIAALQAEVIDVIRQRSPERLIVLGPGNWQNIDALRDWSPPARENIAVSVHYYEPHAFTHQNAEWLGANAPRYDRAWGTNDDIRAVQDHIAQAADWGTRYGFAMQLGEFGVNGAVPLAQRALWTRVVRDACETHDMGWCAWDFAGAFPVWDRERGVWIEEIRTALLAR